MSGWDIGGDYDAWRTSGYDAYIAAWVGSEEDEDDDEDEDGAS